MAPAANINNMILGISGEHKIIMEYIVNFDKSLKEKDYKTLSSQIKGLAGFLEEDLLKHFAIEEQFFFPAVVLAMPSSETIGMVLDLQKQHGRLERELEEFEEIAKGGLLTSDASAEDLSVLKRFMNDLKEHAQFEIKEFFPLLDGSRKAIAHLKKLLKQASDQGKSSEQ